MLNVFPYLLSLQLLAPFVLRVAVGLIFLGLGWLEVAKQRQERAAFFDNLGLRPGIIFVWFIGILELVAGGFLVVGFLTQAAALFAVLVSAAVLALKKKHPAVIRNSYGFLILVLLISISLLFSGAGFWAFDLPL